MNVNLQISTPEIVMAHAHPEHVLLVKDMFGSMHLCQMTVCHALPPPITTLTAVNKVYVLLTTTPLKRFFLMVKVKVLALKTARQAKLEIQLIQPNVKHVMVMSTPSMECAQHTLFATLLPISTKPILVAPLAMWSVEISLLVSNTVALWMEKVHAQLYRMLPMIVLLESTKKPIRAIPKIGNVSLVMPVTLVPPPMLIHAQHG